VVCVIARSTSESLTSLVKQIDKKIAENKKLKSFVVILTDDASKTSDQLKSLAKDANVKSIPLTLIDNLDGPSVYQIAKDAEVTVMMWEGTKVKVNHAYKGKVTDKEVNAIVADIPKILGD
jgi:hypothetical protein